MFKFKCFFLDFCPEGWVFFVQTGLCYLAVEELFNHTGAVDHCQSLDASIVDTKSTRERQFVSSLFSANTLIWVDGDNSHNGGQGKKGTPLFRCISSDK